VEAARVLRQDEIDPPLCFSVQIARFLQARLIDAAGFRLFDRVHHLHEGVLGPTG
jgi:hypothetical protein